MSRNSPPSRPRGHRLPERHHALARPAVTVCVSPCPCRRPGLGAYPGLTGKPHLCSAGRCPLLDEDGDQRTPCPSACRLARKLLVGGRRKQAVPDHERRRAARPAPFSEVHRLHRDRKAVLPDRLPRCGLEATITSSAFHRFGSPLGGRYNRIQPPGVDDDAGNAPRRAERDQSPGVGPCCRPRVRESFGIGR